MNIDKTLNQLCAVLLAKSLTDLYPQSLLGESQILDEGFSYAFLTDCNVSSNDLPKIVKQMQKNIDRAFAIKYQIISKKQALSLFAHNRFKITLIQQHANDEISIIRLGDEFVDLCPHLDIQKLSDIKSYDLLNVSGVY
jgi:threonyl-tRNA synthetase